MKDAYEFKRNKSPQKNWAKTIWCNDIPPSKSLLVWRLMLDKVPTDDKLMERGCCLPSMCSLCNTTFESSFHLFFTCRNNARFHDKSTHWRNVVSWISTNTALVGNKTSMCSNSSLIDFKILKHFNINIHPPKAISIHPPNSKEVIWLPPLIDWVKCNTDGASTQISSACGGIFRNHLAEFICCFAENTGINTAYFAELCGVMRAIEIATDNGWINVWLETDSTLVVLAFKSASLVPWKIRNRWNNCMHNITNMNFMISHIYREGNNCADALANIGLTLVHLSFWNELPQAILESYSSDRLGRPKFRFSYM
ncbi:uncharacterized protein LOC123886479 [Trifolium pratense]|uniref:uncharacterized protein LOC123886479 n=1 Tax=Trifolium pratense TaxID=57577 RepID=UPI001E695BB1|nr:uncharacterized protein LOC123886479 [Trifolium pratense]